MDGLRPQTGTLKKLGMVALGVLLLAVLVFLVLDVIVWLSFGDSGDVYN
jgi:hypothetical protein